MCAIVWAGCEKDLFLFKNVFINCVVVKQFSLPSFARWYLDLIEASFLDQKMIEILGYLLLDKQSN